MQPATLPTSAPKATPAPVRRILTGRERIEEQVKAEERALILDDLQSGDPFERNLVALMDAACQAAATVTVGPELTSTLLDLMKAAAHNLAEVKFLAGELDEDIGIIEDDEEIAAAERKQEERDERDLLRASFNY